MPVHRQRGWTVTPRTVVVSLAQKFAPKGAHVAHVGIDGQIDEQGAREMTGERVDETFLDSDRTAETYWHLVERDDVSSQPFEVHRTNGPQNSEFI